MKKTIKNLFTAGIALVTISVPSIEDFIYNIVYKFFKLELPNVNGNLCMIIGLCTIGIAAFMYINTNNKSKTISIIGLDSKYQADNLPDTHMLDIRENIKKLNNNNSTNIIKDFICDIDKFIDNYLNKEKSYYGVAPIPFIALAGTRFKKEIIANHYEYNSSNDRINKLNFKLSLLLPKMKINRINKKTKDSVICISTTSKITKSDLTQFSNYNIHHFYLENCKDNIIISEEQLKKYSDLIVKEIYEISKLRDGKIYLIGSCQSSLIFEIFRKINMNRTLEIIVCNYKKSANPRYDWGLCINNNEVRYVKL